MRWLGHALSSWTREYSILGDAKLKNKQVASVKALQKKKVIEKTAPQKGASEFTRAPVLKIAYVYDLLVFV
jgi:hypothetical protein